MGDHGVAARRAGRWPASPSRISCADPVGGGQGQLQRGGVGDAGAVEVGRLPAGLLGEPADLVAGPVDQGDADAQAAQQGDVEQQVAEIVVLDDRPRPGR